MYVGRVHAHVTSMYIWESAYLSMRLNLSTCQHEGKDRTSHFYSGLEGITSLLTRLPTHPGFPALFLSFTMEQRKVQRCDMWPSSATS